MSLDLNVVLKSLQAVDVDLREIYNTLNSTSILLVIVLILLIVDIIELCKNKFWKWYRPDNNRPSKLHEKLDEMIQKVLPKFWESICKFPIGIIIGRKEIEDRKKKQIILEIISYLVFILIFIYFIIEGTPIKEIAFYYTLSSISQTLAAMIAFTGMFLVYRLQIIENERVSLSNQFEKLALKAKDEGHLYYFEESSPNYNILYNLSDLNHEKRYEKLEEFFKELSRINEIFIPIKTKFNR